MHDDKSYYMEIAPNAIVRPTSSTFTYRSVEKIPIGSLVRISVGKKTYTGVIMAHVDKPSYDVKPIDQVLELPPLPRPLIDMAVWMAEYYQSHLALVLQTILPAKLTTKRRDRASSPLPSATKRTKYVFTPDQLKALETIEKTTTGTILLHGVTGSGKTKIYIEAVRKALTDGLSAIILVPEISLTSQIYQEFASEFPDVLLTHSRQTEAERHLAWVEALTSNKPRVVIGPRSALFLPLQSIGIVIIDESHEPSYKQEKSPRYSALRVGSILAAKHGGKLILGSATPNIDDYYIATQTNQPIVTMDTLARSEAKPPAVSTVDMTKRLNFSIHPFISNILISEIKQSLEQNRQTLIFHNRRGSSTMTLCNNCGWQAGCARCYIPLTLHADQHQLICHICGTSSSVPTTCPECKNPDIIHKGIGTKSIETALAKLFPEARIARFDGDNIKDSTVEKRYDELKNGLIDIIIGTQVIAKGLDLPLLRTVGIIQADAGLHMPDYSAAERTFQLLSQAIGRVGRSSDDTVAIIQTYQPNHAAIVDSSTQNYTEFYERTIALRRHTVFPPFTFLLKAICAYKTETAAIKNAKKLAIKLREVDPSVEILGPTPAFYERRRDNYRWQIIVKSPSRAKLAALVPHIPGTHWQYELDPINLL